MSQEFGRLSPEDAIAVAQRESRGKHRIYLGYAAGVGKTYAMLREGNRLVAQDEDVVVGYLEHHGRPETQAQLGALELIPRAQIPYKGVFLEEMNLEALLARRPTWVLVDELAHTNVPGSRNSKRYQDVEALLAAGINVMSTVNIQHVESVNDAVGRITGVEIRETFPDWVLDQAAEIIMVDITPELLQERLRQGKIYNREKVAQALKNFFRKGNLLALREMALRKTAEETDVHLGQYRKEKQIEDTWPTVERVLVAITPLCGARALIRRGWRIASRMRGELHVLYVHAQPLNADGRRELRAHFDLAEELGGTVHEAHGPDVVCELLAFAEKCQITQLIIGAGRTSRWEEICRGSLVDRILRQTDNLDVHIVSEKRKQTKGT